MYHFISKFEHPNSILRDNNFLVLRGKIQEERNKKNKQHILDRLETQPKKSKPVLLLLFKYTHATQKTKAFSAILFRI